MNEPERRRCLHSISRSDCVKCCERMVLATAKAWVPIRFGDIAVACRAADALVDAVAELERLEGEGQ